VYAKLESLNPGGSSKDRPAKWILEQALAEGRIRPGSTVIESSSGNMGIGLAQASILFGLRFICVVDPKTSLENICILRAYGAEIEYVGEPDPETREFLPARIQRVRSLLDRIPGSFWPNQYESLVNSLSHYSTTVPEIYGELERVDYLFCATSTCGTVRGCTDFVRAQGLATKVIAVDAVGSVIFGGEKGPRFLPGMGAGIRPPLCPFGQVDRCVHVSDLESVVGCRQLLRQEAIFAGASSGGVISAVRKLAPLIPEGSVCAVILPDRGERYLQTVYCEEWVQQHLGVSEPELTQLRMWFPLRPAQVAVGEALGVVEVMG
jgi:cysteine synthase A